MQMDDHCFLPTLIDGRGEQMFAGRVPSVSQDHTNPDGAGLENASWQRSQELLIA